MFSYVVDRSAWAVLLKIERLCGLLAEGFLFFFCVISSPYRAGRSVKEAESPLDTQDLHNEFLGSEHVRQITNLL